MLQRHRLGDFASLLVNRLLELGHQHRRDIVISRGEIGFHGSHQISHGRIRWRERFCCLLQADQTNRATEQIALNRVVIQRRAQRVSIDRKLRQFLNGIRRIRQPRGSHRVDQLDQRVGRTGDRADDVVNDGLQTRVEHHIAGSGGVPIRAVGVEDDTSVDRIVDSRSDPGGALARQQARHLYGLDHVVLIGVFQTGLRNVQVRRRARIDRSGTRAGDILDHDIVRRDLAILIVVTDEIAERIGRDIDRVDHMVVIAVQGQRAEHEHAQGIVQPAIDLDRGGQRIADRPHDVAAQIGDELRGFAQLIADDGQVEHGAEGIQSVLHSLEHLVHSVDNDGRVAQQEDQRVVHRLFRVARRADGLFQHLDQFGLPHRNFRKDVAHIEAVGRRIGITGTKQGQCARATRR